MSKVVVIDLVGESEIRERKAAPENVKRELLEAPAESLQLKEAIDGPPSGTPDAYRALLVRYLFRR
jgi:hypothetical protein